MCSIQNYMLHHVSRRGRSCLSRQSLWYTALGTGCAPLLQCLGRQPSTLRGTVKWVSSYELSNNNKWRRCLRMVAANLSADSQLKSVGLVWGLAATRRSVCSHQMNRVNSRTDCHDHSTINIVMVIIIIIIKYKNSTSWTKKQVNSK